MEIHQEVEIAAPAPRVWSALSDVQTVVDCIPGAELVRSLDENSFEGRMNVRLGPIRAAFAGQATRSLDPAGQRGTVSGSGLDRGSGSRAKGSLSYAVEPRGEGARLLVDSSLVLSGTLAQFGRSAIVQEVARQITAEFATRLEAKLAAQGGPAAQEPAAAAAGRAASVGAPRPPAPKPRPDEFAVGATFLRALGATLRRFFARLLGRAARSP